MTPAEEMLALVPTDGRDPLVRIAEVPEPTPAPDEAVGEVEAFSINRGETFLVDRPRVGWRPGKDVAGRVVKPAADASGPPAGVQVLLTAAAGGVGHYYAELASAAGAYLTVLSADRERAERLLELGANAGIHDIADVRAHLSNLTSSPSSNRPAQPSATSTTKTRRSRPNATSTHSCDWSQVAGGIPRSG